MESIDIQAQTGQQQQECIIEKAEGNGQHLLEADLEGASDGGFHKGRSLHAAIGAR